MNDHSATRPDRVDRAITAVRTLHRQLLDAGFITDPPTEVEQHLLARFDRLFEHLSHLDDDYHLLGRDVLVTIQSRYPELWPAVDRELLWLFGGECLHFLTDEEIAAFQAREEAEAGH